MAGGEGAAAEHDPLAAVGAHVERAPLAVDRLDAAAGSILDAEGVAAAAADDAVAACELEAGDCEPLGPEPPVRLHQHAGERVQLANVAAAQRDHHVAGEVASGRAPPVGK